MKRNESVYNVQTLDFRLTSPNGKCQSDNISERVKVMERVVSDFNQTHIYDR